MTQKDDIIDTAVAAQTALGPTTVLKAHDYTTDSKTFFIWEAVSQYLMETAVRQTFDFLAQAPTGSRLAFTYVLKDFIEGKTHIGWRNFTSR